MTKAEIAQLLTVIAVIDHRTLSESDVEAWHLIVADLDLDDALQAVKDHYRDETAWLMPAHIARRATAIASRREGQQRIAELEAIDAAETRALEATPTPPIDRDTLRSRLAALAARGPRIVPRVDWRSDDVRLAEARAELDDLRVRQAVGTDVHEPNRTEPAP